MQDLKSKFDKQILKVVLRISIKNNLKNILLKLRFEAKKINKLFFKYYFLDKLNFFLTLLQKN